IGAATEVPKAPYQLPSKWTTTGLSWLATAEMSARAAPEHASTPDCHAGFATAELHPDPGPPFFDVLGTPVHACSRQSRGVDRSWYSAVPPTPITRELTAGYSTSP